MANMTGVYAYRGGQVVKVSDSIPNVMGINYEKCMGTAKELADINTDKQQKVRVKDAESFAQAHSKTGGLFNRGWFHNRD